MNILLYKVLFCHLPTDSFAAKSKQQIDHILILLLFLVLFNKYSYTSFQNSARITIVTHKVKAETLDFSTYALPRSL